MHLIWSICIKNPHKPKPKPNQTNQKTHRKKLRRKIIVNKIYFGAKKAAKGQSQRRKDETVWIITEEMFKT